MQTVYNSELQFQEMVTRWPGSTHDDIFDDSYLPVDSLCQICSGRNAR